MQKSFVQKPFLVFLPLIILLACAYFCLTKIDATKTPDWYSGQFTYLPSGKLLKPAALGFDEAMADGLWIEGMIYFADAYLEGKKYEWMGHILDIVTTLNPQFKHAYEFAGVILTKEKANIPKTLPMLEKGIKQFPDEWRLNIYAALAQLKWDSNYVKAAEYVKGLSKRDDIPSYTKTIYATFLNRGGEKQISLAFLIGNYVRSENEINKEIFYQKILNIFPLGDKLSAGEKKKVRLLLDQAQSRPQLEPLVLKVLQEWLEGHPSPQSLQIINALKV